MSNPYFLFFEDQILLYPHQQGYQLPTEQQLIGHLATEQLLIFKETHCCYARLLSKNQVSIGKFFPLREAYVYLGDELFHRAGRAKQLLDWYVNHQYCGQCGMRTQLFDHDRAKKCSHCNLVNYPHIAPCIVVAITRGDEILLARSPHFKPKIFSVLSGFIEPGESAEMCVHREVFEEVGLKIKNLQFFASQPWSFPNQLMLGFLAEYAEGEINIDPEEIVEARWFKYDALPLLPVSFSLSYQLIQHVVNYSHRSKIDE